MTSPTRVSTRAELVDVAGSPIESGLACHGDGVERIELHGRVEKHRITSGAGTPAGGSDAI